MTKSKTNTKPKGPKTWVPIAPEHYVQQAGALVTHSIKGVNTKAPSCGIRVIPEHRPDFPYACQRFSKAQVALDYLKNVTAPFSASVAADQIEAALSSTPSTIQEVSAEDVAFIRDELGPILQEPTVNAPAMVSPRARQLLFADGEQGISLSPLHSGGFSERINALAAAVLNERAQTAIAEGKTHIPRRFDTVMIKVGGDNPQNAGRQRLIGAMQRACLFSVPTEQNPALRKAFAGYYKGVSLRPLTAEIVMYSAWLASKRNKSGEIRRTQAALTAERSILQHMAKGVLDRADAIAQGIAVFVKAGEFPGLVSPDLPLAVRGAIDVAQRDKPWRDAFAAEVVSQLLSARTREGQSIVGVSGDTAAALAKYIKESL